MQSLSASSSLTRSGPSRCCSTHHHSSSKSVVGARGGRMQQERTVQQLAPSHQHATTRPQQQLTAARAASNSTTASASAAAATDYFATDSRPVILFDGVCNLCNGGVNFMLDWDKQGVYRLAALQSNPGRQLLARCGRSPDDISSIVLVEASGAHYTKSDAVLRIASRLGLPIPVIAAALMPLPHFIRDSVYDQVADNRYNFFGKTNTCRVSDDSFQDRFLGA